MRNRRPSLAKYLFSALVLGILLIYSYGKIFLAPYMGFHFVHSSGEIKEVYVPDPDDAPLKAGDVIKQIDQVSFKAYVENSFLPLVKEGYAGKQVLITVERDGVEQPPILWTLPGISFSEASIRLTLLWVPYVFWLIGALALFVIHPLDERARMFVAFCFISALWIVFGEVSWLRVLAASVMMRSFIWLSLPIYLHFHWIFPEKQGRIPRMLLAGIYTACAGLAILEWVRPLPVNTYQYGLLATFVGCLVLLGIHAVRSPEQRRDLSIFGATIAIALLPSIIVTVLFLAHILPFNGISSLIYAPIIPITYFVILYRREERTFDTRTPRAIRQLLFAVMLLSILLLLVPLFNSIEKAPGREVPITLEIILFFSVFTMLFYPLFGDWVDRRVLKIPIPVSGLLETYSDRISTSLETNRLIRLLRDEVLGSILVRQAALLDLQTTPITTLFTLGLDPDWTPIGAEVEALTKASEQTAALPVPREQADMPSIGWVRLVLPLRIEAELVGLLCLGDRGIDNIYTPHELPALQALANQTALALVNIRQAGNLRTLYQEDIQRQEAERYHLARELHDTVLHHLAELSRFADAHQLNGEYFSRQEQTIESVRGLISGLRPSMLHLGLRIALEEIIDEGNYYDPGTPNILIDLPDSDYRYPAQVELHIYRIVQQACQNAIKHANATAIKITGCLQENKVELTIEDDGEGFQAADILDLTWLVSNRHYGLAGMYERATIIGAHMSVDSQPGSGTRIHLAWSSKEDWDPKGNPEEDHADPETND